MKTLTFKNGTVSVGDIFVSAWGYEQTNIDFYQVISVHGTTTVVVRKIHNKSQPIDSMSAYASPSLNDFCGEPLKRRVRTSFQSPAICIEDSEIARKTQLQKKYQSTSYG